MNELDMMLTAPAETALPPLVRYCKNRLQVGDSLAALVHRSDSNGSLSQTTLVLHSQGNEQVQESREVEWDGGVNAGLVDLGVRATDLQQEGERFALALRAALRKAERTYGDGFLNIVLLDLLDDSDLGKNPEIADVRKFITTNSHSRSRSRSYDACRELLANEIGGRAVELRDKLKYSAEDVKVVMLKALAIYLDERFSVSSRRHYGLL